MTPGGRVSAAIEVVDEIESRRRPAADALKDYGLAHRFAGSKDRAAIATLVYDSLRRRASASWIMGAETGRAIVLGTLARTRDADSLAALCSGDGHAPAPLSEAEQAALAAGDLSAAPAHVRGDIPEWLEPALAAVFGDALDAELAAMAERAPFDLRVNTLKVGRDKAMASLQHLSPKPARFAPTGLRVPLLDDGRGPALAAEPAFAKGWVEVQDEGSQLAVLLARAESGEQILDLCAGGGGKTLALAAAANNRGQIYATDTDGRRLAGLYPRLEKSGARNVQIRAPRGRVPPLDDLAGRCDLVLVDAPCTGTGTWRRNPDAKWRVRPTSLEQRMREQDAILAEAARFVKPGGGRLVYVTCSLLPAENEDRIAAFLAGTEGFRVAPPASVAEAAGLPALAAFADPSGSGLRLTPARTGTDGFFVSTLVRD